MLQRDLKRVANESIFNPNDPPDHLKFSLQAGNPSYWITKAQELLMEANGIPRDIGVWNKCLRDAVSLLILARTFSDEEDKVNNKTGDNTPG